MHSLFSHRARRAGQTLSLGLTLGGILGAGCAGRCGQGAEVSFLAEAGPAPEAQAEFDALRRDLMKLAGTGEALRFEVIQLDGGGKQLCATLEDGDAARALMEERAGEGGGLSLKTVEACP